jgi:hypothetical protein
MKAFVVSVNGRRLWTAGIGPAGVLSAIVNWVGSPEGEAPDADGDADEGFFGHLGGLDTRTDEMVDWEMPALKRGDVVTIELVEVDRVDPESCRRRHDAPPGAG